MIEDVTDREISDMRYAPGERADRFRRAVGARAVTPAISAVLDRTDPASPTYRLVRVESLTA